jgi:hypothetical protein
MAARARGGVEVLKPITITAIEWKAKEDEPDCAVTFWLDYLFRDSHGNLTRSGGKISVGPLAVPDGLLESFVTLGTPVNISHAVRKLGEDSAEQEAVELCSGFLAELLEYGITPEELWTFALNHCDARTNAILLHDPNQSKRPVVRRFDADLSLEHQWKRVQRATNLCLQTARALAKVQRINVAPQLGAVPPLAPNAAEKLILDLLFAAKNLESNRCSFSRLPGRPSNPFSSAFCRDWPELARKHSDGPLYPQGAALHGLIFGTKSRRASFKALCMRVRIAVAKV